MAEKKPKPKPTNKVATPWLSPSPKPTATATPKPMKSPKPPKVQQVPEGTPQWQKDIINDQYYNKYQDYLRKKKQWSTQQKGK